MTYSDASRIRFGMLQPRDWLNKAHREINRLTRAVEPADRLDCAINAVMTTQHIEDWVYHAARKLDSSLVEQVFKDRARKACMEHKVLVDLCSAAKHFDLTRPKVNDLETLSKVTMTVEVSISSEWPKDFSGPTGTEVSAVRMLIDDDEIIGYETRLTGNFVSYAGKAITIDSLLPRAIEFWSSAIDELESDRLSDWMK